MAHRFRGLPHTLRIREEFSVLRKILIHPLEKVSQARAPAAFSRIARSSVIPSNSPLL